MSQNVIHCSACGAANPEAAPSCIHCRFRLELTRGQRTAGLAFLLNELRVAPFTETLTPEQSERLHAQYEGELRALTGERREPAPQPPPARRVAPPRPGRAVAAAANGQPRDWSWLAEQQANLFLFAGAFLTVIAALFYVGYSGQAVSGALKMTLLALYTSAFLVGGVVCLRIPRVAIAGQVFFAVGAILVPMNFVAARSIFSDRSLSTESLWLGGSLLTAAFYSAVAYAGLSRVYAFGGGVALVSAVLGGTVVAGVAEEWRPLCFIALAIAMALTDIAASERLRRCLGSIWAAQARVLAVAAILWAIGLAPFATTGRPGEFQFQATTLWFLPLTFGVLLAYAALLAVVRRAQDAAWLCIAAFAGGWISVAYATGTPANYYVLAIAALAPILGAGMLAVAEPAARRLPQGFGEMLHAAGVAASIASALGALIVAEASAERADVGSLERWSLAPAFAFLLAFYLIDAFGGRRRSGPAGAALALAGICAAVVFGVDASAEYYAFAFVVPAIALAVLVRWTPNTKTSRLHASWRGDVRIVGTGLAVAGVAIAVGAALAAFSAEATYQPQYRGYLPLVFALAAVFFAIEASREKRAGLTGALLVSLGGAIVSLPYVFEANAAWYGAAFAATGAVFGYGGRAWSPRWLDERARDGVAVASMTVAWLPFEPAYTGEARLGAAVHLAAASFYATAAVVDRSRLTLSEVLGLTNNAPVRAAMAWLYPAALTGMIGYVFFLRSMPAGEGANAGWFAVPLMAPALGFAGTGATTRWWRPEFRVHLYLISLAVAISSVVAADSAGTLAALVTAYAATYGVCAAWEDAPWLGVPSVVFAFAAVPAWRARADAPFAAIPAAYSGLGLGLGAFAAVLRRVKRWHTPLLGAATTVAAAAPLVGFGMLAAHADRGLVDGVRFERTALYQWSTLAVALAGGLGLWASWTERRRWGIVPATAVLTVALLLEIGHFRPSNPQWYTTVIGAYLVALGLVGFWKLQLIRELEEAAAWIEALGASVIMAPSAVQSLQGEWRYLLVLLIESSAFFAAGVTLRRRGMLAAAMLFLVGVAGRTLFDAVNALPNWVAVMLAGITLLAIGMGILLGRERWSALQRSLLGWWDGAGGHHDVYPR
ncbi:MAG TPA: hypothetical protein VEZ14_05330 [Dehalococcoidia bacterium]|nr:hypothetical protein [Dehalococcoidia bacterium]